MKNQRFRDMPLDEIVVPIHFVPDEAQMEEWLNSLCVFEPTLGAEKILQAICALDRDEIKTSLKIKLLHKIHQFFPILAQALQKSYLDSSLPLSDQETRNVELVVWIYMQLARSFRQCKLKYTTLGKEHQAGLLYLSLEALTQALLHISLSYKMPMHGFWGLCYELYARAEQANLTQIEITWDGRRDESIAKLFKQLLIFYLCDTQQFRSRDMLMLFEGLSHYSTAARILENYQPKWQLVVCVFNLNKDLPPQKINSSDARDDLSERFITTVRVANAMCQGLQQASPGHNALRSINHEVMHRALNVLGLARKRKFTRVFEKNEFDGLVGLSDLIDYLSLRSDLKAILPKPIQPKPPSKSANKKPKPQFNLVPVGEEIAHQMRGSLKQTFRQDLQHSKLFSYSESLPSDMEPVFQLPPAHFEVKPAPVLCRFEMQDSSVKGYGMLTKLPTSQLKVGDVIAIIPTQSGRIEVGLIRRINQMPEHYLRLGIEVIGFESELVYVSNPRNVAQGILAILLPGVKSLKQPDSLIFNSSLFKQGDTVDIRSKHGSQQYRMQRVVQMTLAATHIELSKIADPTAEQFIPLA
jgi:cyclic-di-GMP-binding protein